MVARSVIVEADGGSRGNPGDAAYGAVLLDATSGEVIAERGECIGRATNNVAEYRGLIAGLELYRAHADGGELTVRMDSKLVVEQMAGRWKIKHPDMRPLALQAGRLAPAGTTYTWIPREQNKRADTLVNRALDEAAGRPVRGTPRAPTGREEPRKLVGWSADLGEPTTLVLVRHGQTDLTRDKRFSGHGGADPALNDEGWAQVRATAEWLAPLGGDVDAVLTSPLRRTRETASVLADRLGHEVTVEEDLVEVAFGAWDGLTFAEVRERHGDDLDAWLGGLDVAPTGGGESFAQADRRVRRLRDRLVTAYPGGTVVAVTHVTPIKVLVRLALGAPLDAVFRMELAQASVTVVSWFPDGEASLRMFNARPLGAAFTGR